MKVGFYGGGSICELGPKEDILVFFKCFDIFVAQREHQIDYNLLSDRFYKRYLRFEELDQASAQMKHVKKTFKQISSDAVNWKNIGLNLASTKLDLKKITLAEVFARYFECFDHCVESAKLNLATFGFYQPVRPLITDQPWFMLEKRRPLSEYDALEGLPFWLQGSQERQA